MVVIGRLSWLARQVRNGRKLHVAFGQAKDSGKFKIKVVLSSMKDGRVDNVAACGALALLEFISSLAKVYCVVDRGHKHSDGSSVVQLWFSGGGEHNGKDNGNGNDDNIQDKMVGNDKADIQDLAAPLRGDRQSCGASQFAGARTQMHGNMFDSVRDCVDSKDGGGSNHDMQNGALLVVPRHDDGGSCGASQFACARTQMHGNRLRSVHDDDDSKRKRVKVEHGSNVRRAEVMSDKEFLQEIGVSFADAWPG